MGATNEDKEKFPPDGALPDIRGPHEAVTLPLELISARDTAHQALPGALALISSRPLANLHRLFAPLMLPAAGRHGQICALTVSAVNRSRAESALVAVTSRSFPALAAVGGVTWGR